MFNLLKKTYRRSNVYTLEQTINKLGEHEQTTATLFTEHRDWDTYLDRLYYRFDPGTVKKYHNFSVSYEDGPTFMKIEVSRRQEDGDLRKTKLIRKRGTTDDARRALLEEEPALLATPGVPLIKRIELGTKWRSHVPPELQDEICPIPTKDEIEANKNNRKARNEKRKARRAANPKEEEAAPVAAPVAAAAPPDDTAAAQQQQQQTALQQQQMAWLTYQQSLTFHHPFNYRHY